MFFFNKFFLIVSLLFYPFSGLFSQKLDYKDIEFKLNIEHDSIGAMDPLFYQLCLLNNDKDKAKKVWSPWPFYTKPKLEIKSECNAKWEELVLSDYMPKLYFSSSHDFDYKNSPQSKKVIEIEPNTYICEVFSWIDFYDLQGGSWNENCNNYSIRAKLDISKNKKRPRYIYSNEVSLSIIPYKGVDSTAFNFLMELKQPYFLYELLPFSKDYWGLYSIYNPHTFSDATEFLEKFPKSQFSPWVKLHLAYCYKFGIGGIKVEVYKAKKIVLSLIADNSNSEIKKLAEELLQEINNKGEED